MSRQYKSRPLSRKPDVRGTLPKPNRGEQIPDIVFVEAERQLGDPHLAGLFENAPQIQDAVVGWVQEWSCYRL